MIYNITAPKNKKEKTMFGTVLFDLDGTLADSCPGITNSVKYALKKLGYPVPSEERLREFIGPPLFDEFVRLGLDEETARKAVSAYREYYPQNGIFECALIDGAEKLLAELKRQGKNVCLATSKPQVFAQRILEHFGIDKYFDLIGGATMDGKISTKIQVLRSVLSQTGADPKDCVLIGDRCFDIDGAHEAGIKCIAVLVGYGSREEFLEHNADYICSSLLDTLTYI